MRSLSRESEQEIERRIDERLFPYITRKVLTVADLTPSLAAKHPFRKALVSDGAGNKYEAMSNGTAFFYMDGSAV